MSQGYWWGPNSKLPDKNARKTVKIVPKRFDVRSLEDKFSSTNYYRGCITLVKKINNMLGLPDTFMDINVYESEYDTIVKYILDNYTIRDHMALTAKMATLACPMKLVGYNGIFIQKRKQLLQLPIKMKPADKVIIPWDEMKDNVLVNALERCHNPAGRIVLLAYINGYPLRLHEIVKTTVAPEKRSQYNFLDLQKHKWYVLPAHSKIRVFREFDVSKEFCDAITQYIPKSGFLVARKNGSPYNGNVTLKNIDVHGVSVTHVRNSYETYNYGRKDITDDQKQLISTKVLAHSAATAIAHYTRNDLANEMRDKNDE